MQHAVEYFIDDIDQGWMRATDGSLMINPAVYSIQVEGALGRPTLYGDFRAQPGIKLLQLKYRFIRQWLDLGKEDPLTRQIKDLGDLDATADLKCEDAKIREQIYQRYGL